MMVHSDSCFQILIRFDSQQCEAAHVVSVFQRSRVLVVAKFWEKEKVIATPLS